MARQARCNRAHSEVTHQVNVIEAAKVNVHAALLKLSSGQLPFLGLMNERRWCRQVAWLGTANLWEMGDPGLCVERLDAGG